MQPYKSVNYHESFQEEQVFKETRGVSSISRLWWSVRFPRSFPRKNFRVYFVVFSWLALLQIGDKGRYLSYYVFFAESPRRGPIVSWRYRDAMASRASAWRPTRPMVADSGGVVATASLRRTSHGRRDEEEASREVSRLACSIEGTGATAERHSDASERVRQWLLNE